MSSNTETKKKGWSALLRKSVDVQGALVEYTEYPPSQSLEPYICCYWTMTSFSTIVPSFQHRILPDGCIDFVFELSTSPSLQGASVFGCMKTSAMVAHHGVQDYLGVRFRPGGAFPFLKHPVHELTDRSELLGTFLGPVAVELEDRLFSARTALERVRVLEWVLLSRLTRGPVVDVVVKNGLWLMVQSGGLIRQGDLAHRLGCSARQLRRKFDRWVGVSPKSFSRIVRFLRTMEVAERAAHSHWASLAVEAGYSDQAHMIHDFKDLSGLAPSQILRRNEKNLEECPILTIQSLRALVTCP